jgi:hypothetical protein
VPRIWVWQPRHRDGLEGADLWGRMPDPREGGEEPTDRPGLEVDDAGQPSPQGISRRWRRRCARTRRPGLRRRKRRRRRAAVGAGRHRRLGVRVGDEESRGGGASLNTDARLGGRWAAGPDAKRAGHATPRRAPACTSTSRASFLYYLLIFIKSAPLFHP